MDNGRINQDERGEDLGKFDTGDQLIAIYKDGTYEVNDLDLNKKYDPAMLVEVARFNKDTEISAMYYEGEKGWTMVKRFKVETSKLDDKFSFITESKGSKLYFASAKKGAKAMFSYKTGGKKFDKEMDFESFIDIKGYKALGNKLGEFKILKINKTEGDAPQQEEESKAAAPELPLAPAKPKPKPKPKAKAKPAPKKPAAKKPAVKKPAAKKPAATKKPAAKKSAAKKPTAKKSTTKKAVPKKKSTKKKPGKDSLNTGDTIELDF
jgi:hypothetical protein